MKQLAWIVAAVSVVAVVESSKAAVFYQYARVSLNDTATAGGVSEIGTNPAAVAWNGTDAIIAGYNGGTTTRDVAMVKVSNVLTAPVIGNRFGVRSTPNGRGYISLDIKGNTDIAAAYDSGTTATSAFAMYNYDETQRWSVAPGSRPNAGASFDPISGRVTFIYQGTNLLRNYDVAAGGPSTGTADAQLASLGLTTAHRDLDYDNTTGNVWLRTANDVVRGNRTGASTYSSPATLAVNLTDAGAIVGQNIAYLHGLAGSSGPIAIYNNRTSAAAGQTFEAGVNAVRNSDLGIEALSFLVGDGSASVAFTSSIGLYDFGWDETSQTLAIVDYSNRELFVFGTAAVVPEPAALSLLGVPMLAVLRRKRA